MGAIWATESAALLRQAAGFVFQALRASFASLRKPGAPQSSEGER